MRNFYDDIKYGYIDREQLSHRIVNPVLVSNSEANSMLGALRAGLESCDSFVFSVAFVTNDGLGAIKNALVDFSGHGKIITSDYLDFNEPDALRELLALDNVEVFIANPKRPHHAKGYIFRREDYITAIIGSANLTRNALVVNQEWNLKFSTTHDGDIADQLNHAVEDISADAVVLTEEWIRDYEENRKKRVIVETDTNPIAIEEDGTRILPNKMQHEALSKLQRVIDAGEKRALIISATGTGKTILSALAVRRFNPRKMLFIVHREQILNKAAKEYQRVLECDDSDIGFFVGDRRDIDARYVFASIQSLSRRDVLVDISPKMFDYIVIDEVHRSGAESYRRVIEYFDPDFLLGMTATPERTDSFDVFGLFDYNIPYEIRLADALEEAMLVPFDYYGVADYQAAHSEVGDKTPLEVLVSDQRVNYIVDTLQKYSLPSAVKGLIFCSRNEEARVLSEKLNHREVYGQNLRTVALSGDDKIGRREEVVEKLQRGEIDYIVSVDIFNEGVDIPDINQVVFLRGTESSIVFTQQLGRGLRKYPGKRSLRAIDFIGNYAKNYLIPIALTGNRSGDKEGVKRVLRRAKRNPVAGFSSISFDKVSQQRVLDSLTNTNLVNKAAIKEAVQQLKNRLGRLPRLIDFKNHDSLDPVLIVRNPIGSKPPKYNYWSMLAHFGYVEQAPSVDEEGFLTMLSLEILNGKRPHEAMLLTHLLGHGPLSVSDYRDLLESENLDASEHAVESVERILNLKWFTDAQRERYGNEPLAEVHNGEFRLGERFRDLYFSYAESDSVEYRPVSFRSHVDDVLETSLFINRLDYGGEGDLQIGKTYTRKDSIRLLNWANDYSSTVYGYRTDQRTRTCPIFVIYHKAADVEENLNYKDEFVDASTMHWVSRHGKTLKSKEIQDLLSDDVATHLFVQREDAEGSDYVYLGEVTPTNARNSTMPGKDNKALDVVVTDLKLEVVVPPELLAELTAPLNT